jgi:hypothetical protein
MTAPQKKAYVDSSTPALLDRDSWDADDRGPANAVIAKLAAAIAEQNAAKQTLAGGGTRTRTFKWRPLIALALGSATLWVIAILAIWSLL